MPLPIHIVEHTVLTLRMWQMSSIWVDFQLPMYAVPTSVSSARQSTAISKDKVALYARVTTSGATY